MDDHFHAYNESILSVFVTEFIGRQLPPLAGPRRRVEAHSVADL